MLRHPPAVVLPHVAKLAHDSLCVISGSEQETLKRVTVGQKQQTRNLSSDLQIREVLLMTLSKQTCHCGVLSARFRPFYH